MTAEKEQKPDGYVLKCGVCGEEVHNLQQGRISPKGQVLCQTHYEECLEWLQKVFLDEVEHEQS